MMDDSLIDAPESRLRSIFSRGCVLTAASSASAEPDAGPSASTGDNHGNDAAKPAATSESSDFDPLYPSLDVELPQVHRPARRLFRPSWDPRERWRQLKPTQPWHAPPESDLPAQFRYEDLSVYEKSETMDIHEDRLLRWLYERFESGLQYKQTAAAGDTMVSELTGEQAIKQQEFTELQELDEQLSNLGLVSADPVLAKRRRELLRQQEQSGTQISVSIAAESSSGGRSTSTFTDSRSSRRESVTKSTTIKVAGPARGVSRRTASTSLSLLDELSKAEAGDDDDDDEDEEYDEEDEVDEEEFGAFASPSLRHDDGGILTQTTQTVVTVHEGASWQQQPIHLDQESANPPRSSQKPAAAAAARPRRHWAGGDADLSSSSGAGVATGRTVGDFNLREVSDSFGGHRVQQFGDAMPANCESGDAANKKSKTTGGRYRNTAEEIV